MGPLSIRARLTLWYSGVVVAILLLVSVAAYSLLRWHLFNDLDASLFTVAGVLRDVPPADPAAPLPPDLEPLVREFLGSEFADALLQLLDPEGRVRSRAAPRPAALARGARQRAARRTHDRDRRPRHGRAGAAAHDAGRARRARGRSGPGGHAAAPHTADADPLRGDPGGAGTAGRGALGRRRLAPGPPRPAAGRSHVAQRAPHQRRGPQPSPRAAGRRGRDRSARRHAQRDARPAAGGVRRDATLHRRRRARAAHAAHGAARR